MPPRRVRDTSGTQESSPWRIRPAPNGLASVHTHGWLALPFVVESEAIMRPPRGRPWQISIGSPVKAQKLLNNPIRVVNIGLQSFAKDLKERGVQVVHVAWRPTAGANSKLTKLLSKLGT